MNSRKKSLLGERHKRGQQSVSLTSGLPSHFCRMKLLTGLFFCALVLGVSGDSVFDFISQAFHGKGQLPQGSPEGSEGCTHWPAG